MIDNVINDCIYINSNGTIPFIGKNANGYFKQNGEKIEINSQYIFFDVYDNISIVAKINKNKDDKNYEDYIYDNLEVFVIDNNLNVISDTYESVSVSENFIYLYKDGGIDTIYNKEGKELVKDKISAYPLSDNIICVMDRENKIYKYELYNKNGKLNSNIYVDAEVEHNFDEYNISLEDMLYDGLISQIK